MRKTINLFFGGVLLTSLLLGTSSFAEEKAMSNQKEIGQKGMMNMGDKGMMGKGMMDGKMMGMMGMCPMMQSMMQKQVVPTSDEGIIGIRPTNAGPPGLDSGIFFGDWVLIDRSCCH